jgi:hypothetical protein
MRFDDNSTFLRTIAGRPFLGEGCGCVPLIIYTRSDLMLIAWLFLLCGIIPAVANLHVWPQPPQK